MSQRNNTLLKEIILQICSYSRNDLCNGNPCKMAPSQAAASSSSSLHLNLNPLKVKMRHLFVRIAKATKTLVCYLSFVRLCDPNQFNNQLFLNGCLLLWNQSFSGSFSGWTGSLWNTLGLKRRQDKCRHILWPRHIRKVHTLKRDLRLSLCRIKELRNSIKQKTWE